MITFPEQLNDEMARMVERVGGSLVQVHSGGGGTGAGTIWHPDGLIVTNAHVSRRLPLRVLLSDGRAFDARILVCDAARDLAALVIPADGLPTIDVGDSLRLQPGQWVMALGHPWGIRGALTAGVVIGMEPESRGEGQIGREWIVVSLHLRPGYSGGPLLDVHGRLVGINTMINGSDVGMAVPVHVVKAFLRERL